MAAPLEPVAPPEPLGPPSVIDWTAPTMPGQLDAIRKTTSPSSTPPAAAPAPAAAAPAATAAAKAAPVRIGAGTDPFAVEVHELAHDPELDEAVISFANADFEACEQAISQLIQQGEAGEERKRLELRKLDALLGYCESTQCRRQALLGWFGEAHGGACGNCDNCLDPPRSWDGTQAALDYYGRSAKSAADRNITGHVFQGVLENGHPNTLPVSFYDPVKPLSANRWVRYGLSGVAENYIRDAGSLRLHTVELRYRWNVKKDTPPHRAAAYATNIILWTASEGTDPNQLLLDHSSGLDFFQPAIHTHLWHQCFTSILIL